MNKYDPKQIEPKWQAIWEESNIYKADLESKKEKFFGFGMFNYPSGAGIHVGHVRNYTIPDVITRFKRQQGFATYQPVGWDSFGLPAENYAIKTGVSPQESTQKAIEKYQQQYRAMGWGVDWTKEIDTTDPNYYRWTQWIFAKLFENGFAYQKESAQWWCDKCKTVLADEQVINGKCWRHEGADDPLVSKRNLKQWFFKITDYADAILEATDGLNWTSSVKASQKSWIGKSVGAEVVFAVDGNDKNIEVFTTRPDTLFGATFLVLAPEHELVKNITTKDQEDTVEDYVVKSVIKTEVERQEAKYKTGVFTGSYAINPLNNEKIPIWIADYVLTGYGTGAIMAVPAHDERDYEFAKQYNLPMVEVISGGDTSKQAYIGSGKLINSAEFDSLDSKQAIEKITKWLEDRKIGKQKTNYKMRDWLISRQRYWGAPIPIIHCEDDGAVLVPESDLPVLLPEIEEYKPTGGNVSVLAGVEDWVNVACPKCGKMSKRETDTMDGYVCSSWYFLRYLNPHDDNQAWSPEVAKKWFPVDFYNGGAHATAHLLYARFFMRFFHQLGLVDTPEPFGKMVYNGLIRAADGSAFSKTLGNGMDPLEVIESGYGADALRLYEMFAAPVEQDVLWDIKGVPAMHRFLGRVWTFVQEYLSTKKGETESIDGLKVLQTTHKTIKKVTQDIESDKYNTAIAACMEALNTYNKYILDFGIQQSPEWKFAVESLLQILAPFAPHITEELWQQLGNTSSIHVDTWPKYDPQMIKDDVVTIVIQVNGKLRGEFVIETGASQESLEKKAIELNNQNNYTKDLEIIKTIVVPNRLVNFVVKQAG
jgi:leucyl-tRNA synthetase